MKWQRFLFSLWGFDFWNVLLDFYWTEKSKLDLNGVLKQIISSTQYTSECSIDSVSVSDYRLARRGRAMPMLQSWDGERKEGKGGREEGRGSLLAPLFLNNCSIRRVASRRCLLIIAIRVPLHYSTIQLIYCCQHTINKSFIVLCCWKSTVWSLWLYWSSSLFLQITLSQDLLLQKIITNC